MKGFTIIEVLVVLSIFITLLGIGYVSVVGYQRRAPIGATVNTLIADIRAEQTKAMTGVSVSTYQLNLATYTAPENITITTTFPASRITFTKGSGDIVEGANTITITQTLTGEHKIISLNRYGAVTQVQ